MCQAGAGRPAKGKERKHRNSNCRRRINRGPSRRPPCTARAGSSGGQKSMAKKCIFIIFVLCPAHDRGGHGLERRRGGARALGSCQPPAANPLWSGFTAAPPSLGPPVRRRPPRRQLAPWPGPAPPAGHATAPRGSDRLRAAAVGASPEASSVLRRRPTDPAAAVL